MGMAEFTRFNRTVIPHRDGSSEMLRRLGVHAEQWTELSPWTNVYGWGRSLLAASTLLTLIFNNAEILFTPALGRPPAPYCQGASSISIFCLLSPHHLDIARLGAVALLLLVMSGWRPRWTAVPHWWVAHSFAFSATIPDGGDHLNALLTLWLIPVALTDPRKWHWQGSSYSRRRERVIRLISLASLLVIRMQVAGVYLHASVAKFGVEQWADGTAMYYWLTDPVFGVSPWLEPLVGPVVENALGVALITWGSMLLEMGLFMALVTPRSWWRSWMVAGIVFHTTIALFMGLVTFSTTVIGALILYLRPWKEPFRYPSVSVADREEEASQQALPAINGAKDSAAALGVEEYAIRR